MLLGRYEWIGRYEWVCWADSENDWVVIICCAVSVGVEVVIKY